MAESPATTSVRKGVWLFPSAPAMRMVEAVIAAETDAIMTTLVQETVG